METSHTVGGHKNIYEDLLKRLAHADIESSANRLDLVLNEVGEAKVPFCGMTYLVSREGLRRADRQKFSSATGSALIRYVLRGSRSQTVGRFVTLAELAGPLFKQGSYSTSALERPIIKRFQGRTPELLTIAMSFGGKQGGEAGLGSVSLIFDLLPHIPLQLVFYDRDEEFPARAILLFDSNATQVIDFETLAVLITLWVHDLTGHPVHRTDVSSSGSAGASWPRDL
jgi:hypothetical protein